MSKLKKILFYAFLLYFTINSLFFNTKTIQAANLFEDDFENPSATTNKWVIVGNPGWTIDSGKYGIYLSPGLSNAIPNSSYWDLNWTNITYELDLIGTNGVDKNILVKFIDPSNFLEFHANDQGMILEKGSTITGGQILDQNSQILANGINYHFRIDIKNNNEVKVYINGLLVLSGTETQPLTNWKIGLRAGTGGFGSVGLKFDNIVVTPLINTPPTPIPTMSPTTTASPTEIPTTIPTEEPTYTPTAESTATPTPAPTLASLSVPDLKQYSLPWKNKLYAFTKNTIQEYGCALTSVAMVLQYHGHNIMPDKLNDWLKQQPDGYISNGLVNWLAISRYTKLHDSSSSPTLEYTRLEPNNTNLTNELESGRPAILKEPGHFIVAKSILPTTFGINDPGYPNRKELTSYNNSFLGINSYVPSHSDLSYMMFVTNPNVNLELLDSSNSAVDTVSYVEDPISNLLNPKKKSGETVKITLIPKPENGKYVLKVTGPKGRYNLDSYLYDINGKVTKNNIEGRLSGNDTDKYSISFEGKNRIQDKNKKSDFRFWFKDFWKFFKFWH
jgi:hypothetical protein